MRSRAMLLPLLGVLIVLAGGCHIPKVPVTWDPALPVPTEEEFAASWSVIECAPGESDEYQVYFDSVNNRLHISINELGIDSVVVLDAQHGSIHDVFPVTYPISGEGVHFHVVLPPGEYQVSWVDGSWLTEPGEMVCPLSGNLVVT